MLYNLWIYIERSIYYIISGYIVKYLYVLTNLRIYIERSIYYRISGYIVKYLYI